MRDFLVAGLLATAVGVFGALPGFGSGAGAPLSSPFTPVALYGADVRSLAIDPRDPDRLLAGTAGGEIYLSRDGGASWVDPAGGQPFRGWVVAALDFDPNRPGRLWAALWGVWGGGLVVHADDPFLSSGRVDWQWNHEALPGGQIYSLALVPGRPGRLYIGTRRGVYGSRDGGGSWRRLTAAIPEMEKVTSLLVEAGQPETVFAGSWQRAYRSDDGGETWQGVFAGMVADSEVFTLTPVPGRPGEMWASTCGWVYHTTDGGALWKRYQEGFENRRVPSFAVLPDGRLLAGTVEGAHLSADGGQSWHRVTEEDLSIGAIAVHPRRPRRIVLGTEGAGVWISEDGGEHFQPSATGMTNLRTADLAAVPTPSGSLEILAAVNHAGPFSGIHSSIDGGRSFQHQRRDLPTILRLAAAGNRVYAATEAGLYERFLDYEWRRIGEIGQGRVEGVVAEGDRVVAWTAEGLFERRAGEELFAPVPYHHGSPRGAALDGEALWVSDASGLYRLAGGENHAVSSPLPGARLSRVGGSLVLAGEGGLWQRQGLAEPWRRLGAGDGRLLATGDARYPALLTASGEVRLLTPEGGTALSLLLPVPAREVTAALLAGGRLLLATAGHGVLAANLDELERQTR